MNQYGFSESALAVFRAAADEAARRNHEYVGTEHLLAALLQQDGVVASVLQQLGIEPGVLQLRIEEVVKAGAAQGTTKTLPYTSRSRKVLELAMAEARELGHGYVGAEHVLGGLVREEKGVGAQLLMDAGASIQRVRVATLQELSAHSAGPESRGLPDNVQSITIELRSIDGTVKSAEFTSLWEAIQFLSTK